MELTTEMVAQYFGGQLEIQNQGEGYVFRGEIKDAKVEKGTLTVSFVWLAEAPYPPASWKKSNKVDHTLSLEISSVSGLSESRIAISSPIVGELVVFFPPGGSRLDPARVEGLVLTD